MTTNLIDGCRLSLKWGTVKGWDKIPEGECFDLLKAYLDDSPMSCAMDRPDDARKAILCELIDKLPGIFWHEWDGKELTRDEAKKYVMEYRQ